MKSQNIYQAVWYDKEFRTYSLEKKILWVFLLTNANAAGVVDFDEGIFSYVTKVEEELISDIFDDLIKNKKTIYDKETSEVFLVNHFKYNNPANSTKRHKVRFYSDFSIIKSSFVREEVKKKAGVAIKASEKAAQSSSNVRSKPKKSNIQKPHVDK